MDETARQQINKAIEAATIADESFVSGDVSNHFLQVLKGDHGETIIRGNGEGLVHFALSVLKLAKSDQETHQHFDEAGMIDKCDVPLVVVKSIADWEE